MLLNQPNMSPTQLDVFHQQGIHHGERARPFPGADGSNHTGPALYDFVVGRAEGRNQSLKEIAISPAVAHQIAKQGPCGSTSSSAHEVSLRFGPQNSQKCDTPLQKNFASQNGSEGAAYVDPFSWAPDGGFSGAGPEFAVNFGAGPREMWVRPIHVQQPGMTSPPPMVQPIGTLFGPVAAALAKDLVKPELRGNFHDFALKFPLYIQQLSAGQPLTDEVKLILLSSCLDQGAQLELQRRHELGERVRFQDFWNWLAQKYGGDVQASLREELRSLRVQNEGKLSLAAWREFESRFRLVLSRLESPSEEEAQALVLQQLPESLRRSIIREQTKRGQDNPTARLRGIPGLTTARVVQLVQSVIGQGEPVGVTQDRDSFVIKLYGRRSMELLMARNGSLLSNGECIKITTHETKLALDDVFRHAEDELRCQERSDNLGRAWGGRGLSSNSEARRDFEAEISEVKIQDPKLSSQPTPPTLRPTPEPMAQQPSFDSRYDTHASRGQKGGKGNGTRARTPSPARDVSGQATSPRRNQAKGGGKGSQPSWSSPPAWTQPQMGKGGSAAWLQPPAGKGGPPIWSSPPAAKGGKSQGHGKGSAEPRRSSSQEPTARAGFKSPSREHPCACCGAPDHWARDCPNKWCEFCHKEGHTSRECTKTQAGARSGSRVRDRTPPRRGSA
jgi:hypothetical protein